MGYQVDKKADFILRNPTASAILCLALGILGGVIAEQSIGANLFERFGALTVGFSLVVFGIVASELLVRGQYTFWMGEDGEPADPFKSKTVRHALLWQTVVAFLGTIQWGFGSLLLGGENAAH